MGKAGRAKKHGMKMRQRRAAKAQRKAAYSALAGSSRKSKKVHARSRGAIAKHQHLVDHCGNPGCRQCYPLYARALKPQPIAKAGYYERSQRRAA